MPKAINPAADTASSIITGKVPMQIPSAAIQGALHRYPKAIEGYIVAYYYAALTNLFCQACLLPIQQVEDNEVVRSIIDARYRDFCMLDSSIGALDPDEIRASPNSHLCQEVRDMWKPQVKDWVMISKRNKESR